MFSFSFKTPTQNIGAMLNLRAKGTRLMEMERFLSMMVLFIVDLLLMERYKDMVAIPGPMGIGIKDIMKII